MEIKFENYTIKPSVNAPKCFDLYKEAIATRKEDGQQYKREDILGYGMSLESSVKGIIHDLMYEDKRIVSLSEYLTEYKKILAEIGRVTNPKLKITHGE